MSVCSFVEKRRFSVRSLKKEAFASTVIQVKNICDTYITWGIDRIPQGEHRQLLVTLKCIGCLYE